MTRFLVLVVRHEYCEHCREYEQNIEAGVFDEFEKAKEFALSISEDFDVGDFVAILPVIEFYSYKELKPKPMSVLIDCDKLPLSIKLLLKLLDLIWR